MIEFYQGLTLIIMQRAPLAPGEWYHCYARGVEKRKTFLHSKDYDRFLLALHVGNGPLAVHISNLSKKKSLEELLLTEFQPNPLVEIGAFCLMPNHFHLLLREIEEGGISLFMQKVLTGYTMYFNKKYGRTGVLFGSTYNSRHVGNDRYFKRVLSYIHLNPVELAEQEWKIGKGDLVKIEKRLRQYQYSSFSAFEKIENPFNLLVGPTAKEIEDPLPMRKILEEAQLYYQDQIIKV